MSLHGPDRGPSDDVGDGQLAPPFTGRRRRLPEGESRELMLVTALAMLADSGLTVGLDHLRFEEVIAKAGVPRSAAYRLWPYKDAFYHDLLLRITEERWMNFQTIDAETTARWDAIVTARSDCLLTSTGRRSLLREFCRLVADRKLAFMTWSPEWRTHVAVTAAVQSMPESAERARLLDAMGAAEDGFLDRVGELSRSVNESLGFRLRPEFGTDYRALARMGSAVITGLGLSSAAHSGALRAAYPTSAVADGTDGPWTMGAIAFTTVVEACVEEDPDWVPAGLS